MLKYLEETLFVASARLIKDLIDELELLLEVTFDGPNASRRSFNCTKVKSLTVLLNVLRFGGMAKETKVHISSKWPIDDGFKKLDDSLITGIT